ncbi:hypothetical protein EHS13_27660 [Paenibacillus psychroresistens]|uniref:Heparinase n=1 Tax=Paenibacillus psychroresistens TaxID=1778678 RepID=A0A6B8RS76_9BACL|nr:hypothetical protein [Paenibacillus psychroresistens]QGQ98395.1 hypothetical protein EHS13_27660 [Paenibacillus psychroresistens]
MKGFDTMDANQKSVISNVYDELARNLNWSDGLVRISHPGHTREASQHAECHEGRTSADYYAVGSLLGRIDELQGMKILTELSKLQISDPQHPQYGGMRWYKEETVINDTNAAFFILMPLTTIRFLYPGSFPASQIGMLDTMMDAGLEWFAHECTDPILYYPNKIISDGALLLTLSRIRSHEIYYSKAVDFFEKWEAYTICRGWGWGENISMHYLPIILNALSLACKALKPAEAELKCKLQKQMDALLDYIRFQGPGELVPSIRSYNFDGKAEKSSFLWIIAGLRHNVMDEIKQDSIVNNWSLTAMISLLLFEESWNEPQTVQLETPRVRKEHIFDQSYSYTWVGQAGRLGSINQFPVIPGSYQWPTWGLGWQSFPVSFRIEGAQLGYLRWSVKENGGQRTHPARNKETYLSPALFGEEWYPDVQTQCAQAEHMLLVCRSMAGINNQAAELADEWVIHRFEGKILRMEDWVILQYKQAAVAIRALNGISYSQQERAAQGIHLKQVGESVYLRQVLYSGDETTLQHPRLEAAWAVLFLDNITDKAEILQRLEKVAIADISRPDGEVPRISYHEIRQLEMADDSCKVALTIDPFSMNKA